MKNAILLVAVMPCQIGVDQPFGDFGGFLRLTTRLAQDGGPQSGQVFGRDFHVPRTFILALELTRHSTVNFTTYTDWVKKRQIAQGLRPSELRERHLHR